MSGVIAMPGMSWGVPLLTAPTLDQLHKDILLRSREGAADGSWPPGGMEGAAPLSAWRSRPGGWLDRQLYLRALSAEAVVVPGFEWAPGMRAMHFVGRDLYALHILPPGAPYALLYGGYIGVPAGRPPELDALGAFPDLEDNMTIRRLHELLDQRTPVGVWSLTGGYLWGNPATYPMPGRPEVVLTLRYRHTTWRATGECTGEVAALMALRLRRWK